MSDHYDVAIVGYGPAGESLANFLGMQGVRTVVLEQELTIYAKPRVGGFCGDTMRSYQAIGVAEELLPPVTIRATKLEFVDKDENVLWDQVVSDSDEPGPQGWSPFYLSHQPDIDAAMRRAAEQYPCVEVRLGHAVRGVRQSADEAVLDVVDLRTNEGEEVRASYVVGCEGGQSLIRRAIGSTWEAFAEDQRYLVVDTIAKRPLARLPLDSWRHYVGVERPTSFIPHAHSRCRWELMVFPHETKEEMERPEKVWELINPWAGPDDVELDRAVVYTFHSILARPWRDRRLFIAGDAAHQMPPHIGQGQCSSVRDSRNLAWKLAMVIKGQADEHLLSTYETERIPNVLEFIRVATQHHEAASGTRLADVPLRPVAGSKTVWAAEATESGPAVPDAEADQMQGIPQPPLGPGVHGDTRPPIGTLFPQPRLADGRRLDDASGECFTVLGDPEVIDAVSAATRQVWGRVQAAVIADRGDAVRESLRTCETRVVVLRPDRYVLGTASDSTQLDAVSALIPGCSQ